MPRRDDIEKILLIGSGPVVIGQAAEFDYSGVQACKVLREEGYEVVLVNSNPATIMTDPEFADATYVEPLLPGPVRQVIGANYDAIACAEDRDLFRQAMDRVGLTMPRSAIATTVDEAIDALPELGLPCIVRPAYTLGGRG